MVLWKNYGYTSYVAGESGQNISQAYFMLDEIISSHKPKLIILEVDELYGSGYQAILNSAVSRVIPALYNHSRWKTIKSDDLMRKPYYTKHRKNKGFWPIDVAVPYNGDEYMKPDNDYQNIPLSSLPMLDLLVSKCKKQNLTLMLVHLPSAINWTSKRSNSLDKYADEHNLNFWIWIPSVRKSVLIGRQIRETVVII